MSAATRYSQRYGPKKEPPERRAAFQPDRILLIVGAALIVAFLGYSLVSAIRGFSGDATAANVFAALAMLGVLLMLGAAILRRWKRVGKASTIVGFALLASFVGYGLYNATAGFVEHHGVGNAFAMAGMFGLLLVLAAGAMQRLRT